MTAVASPTCNRPSAQISSDREIEVSAAALVAEDKFFFARLVANPLNNWVREILRTSLRLVSVN
jgi:hypothetical protein